MKSFNLPPAGTGRPKKPNRVPLNLLAFALVGLVLTVVSYQVGHEVASQLPQNSAVSQQPGQVPAVLTASETPAPAPTVPAPVPGSVPPVDSQVALLPPTTRPGSQNNPIPTATVPPPAKKAPTVASATSTTRPAQLPATPKPVPPKTAPKPVPTTKAS